MEQINSESRLEGGGGGGADSGALDATTRALATTINQLPELQEKKRCVCHACGLAAAAVASIRDLAWR